MTAESVTEIAMKTLLTGEGHSVAKYKILSLNTNGIRASAAKELQKFLLFENPDVFCLQETKIGSKTLKNVVEELKDGPHLKDIFKLYDYIFGASTLKEGYSGTAIFVKKGILCLSSENESQDVPETSLVNTEGRYTSVEFPQFYLINCYVPNSGRGGEGQGTSFLPERLDWEDEISHIILEKQKRKPVVYCGDLNVVASKLDIYDWEHNFGEPGMTEQEREALIGLKAKCNLIDAFREMHKTQRKYSWFSNFGNARYENLGWRIDYFLIDQRLLSSLVESDVLMHYKSFSDHTPITLQLEIISQ